MTAKDGIGRVAAEGGIRGSPMRAGIRRRAPPARGPGTPEFRNPRFGAQAAARCHGLRGPGRAGWLGRGSGSGPGVEPSAPHLGPGSGRARSPRRLRFSELRRGSAHFRVSGAILGGLAHFRSCRGGGTSGGRGLGAGPSRGDPPSPSPLMPFCLGKGLEFSSEPQFPPLQHEEPCLPADLCMTVPSPGAL